MFSTCRCRSPVTASCHAPAPTPYRLLLVLEDLAGLLVGAGLLQALPLQVALLHLLPKRVGPPGPLQDAVGPVAGEEHWGGKGCTLSPPPPSCRSVSLVLSPPSRRLQSYTERSARTLSGSRPSRRTSRSLSPRAPPLCPLAQEGCPLHPCSTPAPGNLLPVGGEDHSSPFSDDAHDGIPQHAASLGVHARGGLVLGGGGREGRGRAGSQPLLGLAASVADSLGQLCSLADDAQKSLPGGEDRRPAQGREGRR